MNTPSNKTHFAYSELMAKSAALVNGMTPEAILKSAKDQQALNGIKDPSDKGEVSIPGFGDGANRALQGLPENKSNLGDSDKQHNLMSVTKPNGTGEGEYITPENGTAKDHAASQSIDKLAGISQNLQESANASAAAMALYGTKAAAKTPAGAQTEQDAPEVPDKTVKPAPGKEPVQNMEEATEKPASVNMPLSLTEDKDLMSKLASVGLLMIGTEDGQRAVQAVIEKEAGIKECRGFISSITAEMQQAVKEAAAIEQQEQYMQEKQAAAQPQYTYNDFRVAEMAKQAHAKWISAIQTDFEKQAYAAGAEDGAAAADAMAAGGDPAIAGSGDLTEEDLVAYLQQLMEAQVLTQEEAEAILGNLAGQADDGIQQDEFLAALEAAVNNGELTPEQAAQVAQAYAAGGQAVEPGQEEAAAAAAAEDPVAAAAAEDAMGKAASVITELWNPQEQ